MMKAWQRSTRLGGYAALVLGVAGAALTGAGTKIAAGDGFSLALRSDGTVWAWGNNNNGQLGDGTTDASTVPVQVSGLSQVTSIAAGLDSALAIRTQGITTVKTMWAWGADGDGQLGNAPAASAVTRPVETTGMDSGIKQLSAGSDHVLALKSNGTVLAWGDNSGGELGTGSTASVAGAVQVSGLADVTQVSAGAGYSLAIHPAQAVSLP